MHVCLQICVQMCGRAGRSGKETMGESFLMIKPNGKERWRSVCLVFVFVCLCVCVFVCLCVCVFVCVCVYIHLH